MAKSFLVELQTSNREATTVITKSFRADKTHIAEEEVEHLQAVARILQEHNLHEIRVPRVVWSCLPKGLFATEYIPGTTYDELLRKESRVWRLNSRRAPQFVVRRLFEWHKAFFEAAQSESDSLSLFTTQKMEWNRWLHWLDSDKRLPILWRRQLRDKLARIEAVIAQGDRLPGIFHGDFKPANVRIDKGGRLWVLDWLRLEGGHWLEGAFRFRYALTISGLSPFAKPHFFRNLIREADNALTSLTETDDALVKDTCRIRAVLRNLFYHAANPQTTPKRWLIRRFWIRELTSLVGQWQRDYGL